MAASIGLLLVSPLCALDPDIRGSQYQKSYWAVEQGLPHSYVTALAQVANGFLWVGTDEGLARFDGVDFRRPPASSTLHLGQSWISALLTARDGSVWIGTFDGVLVHRNPLGSERKYPLGGSVFALLEDSSGQVWASCRNGVFTAAGGRFQKREDLLPPLDTSWNTLSSSYDGALWVVDAWGLKRTGQGKARRAVANGGGHGSVLTAFVSPEDRIWLGTSEGLFWMKREGDSPLSRVPGVRGPVVSLLPDRDEALWAGTWGHGVYRLAGNRVEQWSGRDGLPDDFIRTLFEDNEGNLWIGMRSGGLGRWQEPRITPYGMPEGLAGNYATTVRMDPSGVLWLGTWRGGLYQLIGDRLKPRPTPIPLSHYSARAIAFDRLGHPWLGSWEGLYQFDGRRFVHRTPQGWQPLQVSVLHFDRTGGLWIGAEDHGLLLFPNGQVSSKPFTFFDSTQITALLEDAQGRIWVGTRSGVEFCDPSHGLRFTRRPELSGDLVKSILEDSRGRIWVASASGSVAVFRPEGTVRLDGRNGLPSVPLHRILESADGSFWISSPRGILELRSGALEETLSGKRTHLEIIQYGLEDGMRTIECHGLSQPAGWKASDGSLWFSTARGFLKVRPGRPRRLPPPAVQIDSVHVESGPLSVQQDIRLEAGERNLELQFAAMRLTASTKVEFRFQMEGFDLDWVESGNRRSARYNQLPPGKRAFRVQARDPGGEWGAPATLTVNQLPYFHQTTGFALLLGFAAVGLVLAGYRWRLHSVRSRYSAILEERNRIGREWHDTLVAGFSAISLQVEAAMARLKEQPERSSEILHVTKKMVHHYRAEARRVIWDLRDSRPEGESLQEALDASLRRLTLDRGIEVRLESSGTPVELPIELQHNVLRISQEAISNAARHAGPCRIEVELHYLGETLRVVIKDDGKGFDYSTALSQATGHFGLVVMQERARRYGGRVEVASGAGSGTVVEVTIPVRAGKRR